MSKNSRNGNTEVVDKSPTVHQRAKLKTPVELKELKWTDKQLAFIELANMKECKIIFVKGPAGSSKTALSIYCLLNLLNQIGSFCMLFSPSEFLKHPRGLGLKNLIYRAAHPLLLNAG